MISYKHFCIGKRLNLNPKGSSFQKLIIYDGTNLNEVIDTIKKCNIANLQVRPANIAKKKPNTDFIKLIQNQNDYNFLYLSQGDLVAIKQKEIYIFNASYSKEVFNIDFKTNTIMFRQIEKDKDDDETAED